MTDDSRTTNFEGDAGPPLPDFTTNVNIATISPALGIPRPQNQQPDYLDYDPKGRGVTTVMFANAGSSYLIGILGGGLYGFREGLTNTPNSRFKVKVNSVLNQCGKYGSRAGNSFGVLSILYSLYEGAADHVSSFVY